jgi:lactoylglutathione lyase
MHKKIIYVISFSIIFLISCKNAVPTKSPTLNHIAQYVVNLQTSTSFYQNIVGLDTIPEPFHDGRHTWFSVGNKSHLHLIQGAKEYTTKEKNTHLCFSVKSITKFIEVLTKNKIEYENWKGEKFAITKRVDGVQQIYFNDPDGYWIEINDAKK